MMLDHLFAVGFDVVGAGVVAPTEASDHLPIWVELTHRVEPRDVAGEPG